MAILKTSLWKGPHLTAVIDTGCKQQQELISYAKSYSPSWEELVDDTYSDLTLLEQASHVILWTTGGLPQPFGGLLLTVTCEAGLTQPGWKETLRTESTSPLLPPSLPSKCANRLACRVHRLSISQITGKMSAEQESLDKFIFCSEHPYSEGTANSSGHFSVYRKKTGFEDD